MKDIIITEQSSDTITLEEIEWNTPGIIFSYIGENPTGYITYNFEGKIWTWHPNINASVESHMAINGESLSDLIKAVLNAGKANKFKLMEFYYDN